MRVPLNGVWETHASLLLHVLEPPQILHSRTERLSLFWKTKLDSLTPDQLSVCVHELHATYKQRKNSIPLSFCISSVHPGTSVRQLSSPWQKTHRDRHTNTRRHRDPRPLSAQTRSKQHTNRGSVGSCSSNNPKSASALINYTKCSFEPPRDPMCATLAPNAVSFVTHLFSFNPIFSVPSAPIRNGIYSSFGLICPLNEKQKARLTIVAMCPDAHKHMHRRRLACA